MWIEPGTWPGLVLGRLADIDDERRLRAARRRAARRASSTSRTRAGLDRAPGTPPGLEAAVDVADERLEPDAQRLARQVVEVGGVARRAGRSAGPGRRPSRATSRTTSPAGIDSEPGTCAGGVRRAASAHRRSSAPRPSALVQPVAGQRRDLRHDPAEQRRPGLVHRSHPGEVARDRRLAGQQRPRERVDLHRRQERVVAALVADRRPRGRRDPGRAQRAGAVGRVDHHRVLVAAGGRHGASGTCPPRTPGACSAPSRSVRPTAPTSSEPPVSSRNGSSARDVSATA